MKDVTICVLSYYAGHGIQDGLNYVVLNENGDPTGSGDPAKPLPAQTDEESKDPAPDYKMCLFPLE